MSAAERGMDAVRAAECALATLKEANRQLSALVSSQSRTFGEAYDLLAPWGGAAAGLVPAIHNMMADFERRAEDVEANAENQRERANGYCLAADQALAKVAALEASKNDWQKVANDRSVEIIRLNALVAELREEINTRCMCVFKDGKPDAACVYHEEQQALTQRLRTALEQAIPKICNHCGSSDPDVAEVREADYHEVETKHGVELEPCKAWRERAALAESPDHVAPAPEAACVACGLPISGIGPQFCACIGLRGAAQEATASPAPEECEHICETDGHFYYKVKRTCIYCGASAPPAEAASQAQAGEWAEAEEDDLRGERSE